MFFIVFIAGNGLGFSWAETNNSVEMLFLIISIIGLCTIVFIKIGMYLINRE
jgi:hypothetical protein